MKNETGNKIELNKYYIQDDIDKIYFGNKGYYWRETG